MPREPLMLDRERINVWVLRNQVVDLKKIQEVTGKSMTDIISEAIALYLQKMNEWKVL